jgi:hypothetical protein
MKESPIMSYLANLESSITDSYIKESLIMSYSANPESSIMDSYLKEYEYEYETVCRVTMLLGS